MLKYEEAWQQEYQGTRTVMAHENKKQHKPINNFSNKILFPFFSLLFMSLLLFNEMSLSNRTIQAQTHKTNFTKKKNQGGKN